MVQDSSKASLGGNNQLKWPLTDTEARGMNHSQKGMTDLPGLKLATNICYCRVLGEEIRVNIVATRRWVLTSFPDTCLCEKVFGDYCDAEGGNGGCTMAGACRCQPLREIQIC